MSGESACPIIEAMLRAQIAETRPPPMSKAGGSMEKGEKQPAENFSSGRVLETCQKVQAFHASLTAFLLPSSLFPLFLWPTL